MSDRELNGEGFHYLVSYQRQNVTDAPELKQAVREWARGSLRVDTQHQDTFAIYIIYVQAVNNEGFAPVSQLQKYVAFAGEGSKYHVPLITQCCAVLLSDIM